MDIYPTDTASLSAANGSIADLQVINRLGALLLEKNSISEAAGLSIELLSTAVDADLVVLFHKRDSDLALLASGPDNSPAGHNLIPTHKVGECLCGMAARDKTPIISADINHDVRCTWSECKEAGFRSFAAFPMISRNHLIGIMGVGSRKTHDFSPQQPLLQSCANHLAMGLDNTMLLEQVRDTSRTLEEKVRELTRAKEKIEEQERYYREIFSSVKNAIVVCSGDHTITDVNQPATRDMFGYEQNDIIGRPLNVLLEDAALFKKKCGRFIAHEKSGDVAECAATFVRKDGSSFPGQAAMFRHHGSSIPEKSLIILIDDVSEKKNLTHQLAHSQKMDAVGKLAGGIAHDFNNILTVILGFTGLALMHCPKDAALTDDLLQVKEAAKKAVTLIRQLLLFSRREEMQTIPINLSLSLDNMTKMLHRIIGEDIRLSLYNEPNCWTISGDPSTIDQVIMNLAVNAREAMPDGGTLKMSTTNVVIDQQAARANPDAIPGEYVCLTVTDSGCGIPEAVIEEMFDPFFTTKKDKKGTGLGLSVVYGIVREHGGWINVESIEGQGATFRVFLPAMATTRPLESTTDDDDPEHRSAHNQKILVVEDDQAILNVAVSVLNDHGYEATGVDSAEKAEAVVNDSRGRFDLVITDVVLPQNSGLVLAERIKQTYPEINILLWSGYTEEVSLRQTTRAKEFSFLQKPFTPYSLLTAVKKALLS